MISATVLSGVLSLALAHPRDSDAVSQCLRAEGHGEISAGEPNMNDVPMDEPSAESR